MSTSQTMLDTRPVKRIKIDVTSDVICPYCLIGVKQLLSALDTYKAARSDVRIEADVRILPYQLQPGLPEEPELKRTFHERRFGKERLPALNKQVNEKLAQVGVTAATAGYISSSHLTSRLLAHCARTYPERQLDLAMDLFEAYHAGGQHPSDRSMLSELAVKHGVFGTTEEAQEWLASDGMEEEVQRGYITARRMGVTGVPFFVFQDRYAASGAMGTGEFVELLEEIGRRESSTSPSPSPTSTAVGSAGHDAYESK